MAKGEKRQAAESAVLFQQVMAAALVFLALGLLVYGTHTGSGTGAPAVSRAKRFACPYAEMIRPREWLGGVNGATFVFHNSGETAQAVLHALREEDWRLAALDANPATLAPIVTTTLAAAALSLPGVQVANLQTDQPFHNFPALRFSLAAEGRQGIGVMFFSGDVRYCYLGIWAPDVAPVDKSRVIACLDFVTLPKPYDAPLYQRPVTDSRLGINLAAHLSEAESRLIEARNALDAGQHDMISLQRAMAAVEDAMKKVSLAHVRGAAFPRAAELVAAANECRRLRESRMNLMKGQIMQYQAMGDKNTARAIAHDLVVACSLDSDLHVKAWAERQYRQLETENASE